MKTLIKIISALCVIFTCSVVVALFLNVDMNVLRFWEKQVSQGQNIDTDTNEDYQATIDTLQAEIETLTSQISTLQNQIIEFTNTNTENNETISELLEQITELENSIMELQNTIAQLQELLGITSVSFAVDSWETIAEISEFGLASAYYAIGDEKDIIVGTETATIQILGFNHDNLSSGGKAGITLGMKNLLTDKYQMNTTNTTVGGWKSCRFRTSTMATLFAQLPSELQSVIKLVDKPSLAGAKLKTTVTTQDKLFLFSEKEITGTDKEGYVLEGEQYEYWVTRMENEDRIKYISNGTGAIGQYWLRTSNHLWQTFNTIQSYGQVYNHNASSQFYVCFGFAV